MKILVTGGAGFIGSHVVDSLLASDHQVRVLDNLTTGRIENLEGGIAAGAQFTGTSDICDAVDVGQIFEEFKPDAVVHLAAQIDVRKSVGAPAFDARTNVEGTINMLEAAHQHDVQRFVLISTGGGIYGDAPEIPTSEKIIPAPMAGYGQGKMAAEGYCGLYHRLHGLNTVALRLGNVYGPRQDPLGEAGVIAIFCGKLLAGEQPTIYGSGEQTRDYVHVADVVSAVRCALDTNANGVFNIGAGVETTVLELARILGELRPDTNFVPVHEPERIGEIERSALDSTAAREQLGWTPRVELSAGLAQTLEAVAVEA